MRRDLFDEEQSRFLSDPALLERLATEKLEALAATVREEGWRWVSAFALEAMADDLKASRAWQAVHQAREAWRARLPEDQGEWLGWMIGLPQAELIDLIALCGPLTVNALPGAGAVGSANAIAAALGLEMADWWEPTAEAYLNHVPKAQIVAALKEAGPDLAGGGVEAMKKDALVSAAASRLAGTRWLPEPLRRPPA